jgi:hypothetical protein
LEISGSFFETYLESLERLANDEFILQDHYNLIIFTYQIRNNLFHGLKKAKEMIENGQRIRLNDYSNVLIATADMFFDIMKEKHGYYTATDDELKENLGID